MTNLQEPEKLNVQTPPVPTLEAADGIRFDFNCGLRIQFPESGGPWLVAAIDTETATVCIDEDAEAGAQVASKEKYFVPWQFQIFDYSKKAVVFQHRMDLTGKTVLILITVSTLGDTLAWMPHAERFRLAHGCELYLIVSPPLRAILEKQYPEIHFINLGEETGIEPYATYMIGLWWENGEQYQPLDHRHCGLAEAASNILGLPYVETMPRFDLSGPRYIQEPYVCIAVQSSMQSKNWTAFGWYEVVKFLNDAGYRVLCVDREPVTSDGHYSTAIPCGAEDLTGDYDLQSRIDIIKHADFFIGLSSGLSWVAWGCGIPVVLISGFTLPMSEFYTPLRVYNSHVCHGCWQDMRYDFEHDQTSWCPRLQGTKREHECMTMISPRQVINTIKRIPAFIERTSNA